MSATQTSALTQVSPLPRRLKPQSSDQFPAVLTRERQVTEPLLMQRTLLGWATLWDGLVSGQIRYRSAHWSGNRCVLSFHRPRLSLNCFALSSQEQEMFEWLLLGDPRKPSASKISAADSTLSNCLRYALIKLGFRSRIETAPLAALALQYKNREASKLRGQALYEHTPKIFSVASEELVFAELEAPDWREKPNVTPTERNVCSLIILGKSNLEIAELCEISALTTQQHVASLFKKLGVGGRTGLIHVLYGTEDPEQNPEPVSAVVSR